MGRRYPSSYWLIALGFFVSFLGDMIALNLSGDITWVVTHFYPPLQLGLFALALGSIKVPIALLALTAFPFGLDRPEILITTLGSVAVIYLARQGPWLLIMLVYCGAGTLFYLGFSSETDNVQRFMEYWYPYQGARLIAFGLFVRQAVLLTRNREVPV
jgi:hypothetical protein